MLIWLGKQLGKSGLLRNNKLCLLVLLGIGFFYRVYGLRDNYSFWTDENHTAIFVRATLERGRPVLESGYSTGIYQWGQYWLSAISAKIFGLNEAAVRLPAVIFGVLTIWGVWLLGREIFPLANSSTSPIPQPRQFLNPSGLKSPTRRVFPWRGFSLARFQVEGVALVAAILTTFSKIEILWSRQVRPYQALQFFYVLGVWFLYRGGRGGKGSKGNRGNMGEMGNLLWFLGCGVAGTLMHPLGMVILAVGVVYLLVGGKVWKEKTCLPTCLTAVRAGRWGLIGGIGMIGILGYVFRINLLGILGGLGEINNLFYYRVFLWHNYPLLVFLGVLGVLGSLGKKNGKLLLLLLPLAAQGVIVSFLLGQPFTRYFYPVFPFLILLAAGGLGMIAEGLPIPCAAGIAFGGARQPRRMPFGNLRGFSFRQPRQGKTLRVENSKPEGLGNWRSFILLFLTLFIIGMGHKFTLLPKRVYSLNEDMQEIPEVDWKKIYGFVEKKLEENPGAVLATNWNDLPVWYLGENSLDYLVRKPSKAKLEKDPVSSATMIYSLDEFRQKAIKGNKKGIFVIDSWDDGVPEEIRKYIPENLKKELEVDHLYPIQPRLWPVEVYSWGM